VQIAAIYGCTDCQEERKFGDCADDRLYEPRLNCGICKRPARHQFVRIDEVELPEGSPAAAEVMQ
jgi:hypothetical protein